MQPISQLGLLNRSFHQILSQHITNLFTHSQQYHHFHHFTIFAGLLPKSWTTQASTPGEHHNIPQHSPDTWSTKFSNWLTLQGHEIWKLRNTQVHDNESETSTTDHQLNQKIQRLYDSQTEMGYHDRDIFHQPIEERLALSTAQKMTWIEQTTSTIQKSIEEHKTKMKTGQTDIRKFLQAPNKSH